MRATLCVLVWSRGILYLQIGYIDESASFNKTRGPFCGDELPFEDPITFEAETVVIMLETGSYRSRNVEYRGFKLRYSTTPVPGIGQ